MRTQMLKRTMKLKAGADSGQALIETALSVALLLVLVTGGAELAQAAFAAIEVTNAARAAAQWAAMNGGHYSSTTTSGFDETGMLNAANADAGSLNGSIIFASGYPQATCSCPGTGTVSNCSAGKITTPPPTGCTSPSSALVTVTVKTQATFTPGIWGFGLGRSAFTLNGWDSEQVFGGADD